MDTEPDEAFLLLVGRFVFAAAELEARILTTETVTAGAGAIRRRPGETKDELWERLEAWVGSSSTDREHRRTCADALFDVACWLERVASGRPRVRPRQPPVLEREDPDFDQPIVMDEYYFEKLCRRVADWHGELDQFKPTPSRAEELWGAPNAAGRYLVRVVEFGDDATEDDYSAAGNMELGGLRLAAEEYVGHPIPRSAADRYYTVIGSTYTSPIVAQLADGTLMATLQKHRRGPGRHRDLRRPTERELSAWSASTLTPKT